ncbi:MAG: 2-polyprenyl-6-methoxyphenol hydroxylase-like oxidoreductase [Scytonematopsis contorta HA4267-MV1]|jgi:2-polyprenyl-6-methoxyphenol hydroxylase-like FAD-dependent oxidoreductase|nr:2-polyprenyl-6-methoxyphenol hydroxylase-like oxidoreductase [Scytonematopsis contorta HA4267-MV1]
MSSTTNRSSCLGNHAIVIGGSVAGLLAGRVLADYFERVTIIERHSFPEKVAPCKGVPQSHHIHSLMLRGRMILEEMFPGLDKELMTAGAPLFDMGSQMGWLNRNGWGVKFDSGMNILSFSRSLLDWNIRQRLKAFTNINFLQGCNVTGLLANSQGNGVVGVAVSISSESGKTGTQQKLFAELVVDASGRSSKAPKWLKSLGYEAPPEKVVNAFVGYATRIYECPPGFEADWKAQYVQAAPPHRIRSGALFPIEGNRWIVTAIGGDRDYAPTDESGYLEFLRSLDSQIIYNAVKNAKPLSAIHSFRGTENRLREYEKMSRQPEGFVALGDSVCALNPIYGQGMTITALGTKTLEECLQEQCNVNPQNITGVAQRFQMQLSKVNIIPWSFTISQDARFSCIQDKSKNFAEKAMDWYMDEVINLTGKNPQVRLALFEVMHMLKTPEVLFQRSIFVKVIQEILNPSSFFQTMFSPKESKLDISVQ